MKRLFVGFLLLVFAGFALSVQLIAQEHPAGEEQPVAVEHPQADDGDEAYEGPNFEFGATYVVVDDFEGMCAWYSETFGLMKVFEVPEIELHFFVTGEGRMIGIASAEAFDMELTYPKNNAVMFDFSVDDVYETTEWAVEQGAVLIDEPENYGMVIVAVVLDPEENAIMLIQHVMEPEGAEHPTAVNPTPEQPAPEHPTG